MSGSLGPQPAPDQSAQGAPQGTPYDPHIGWRLDGQPLMLSHLLSAAHQYIMQALQPAQSGAPLANAIQSNPVGTEYTTSMGNATPIDTRSPVQRQLANAAPLATTMVLGMAGGEAPKPAKLAGAMESEPGYVYHATNAERLQDIADSGRLLTHKPGDFTDQDIWPDGSTQKRNYFTPSAQNTWQFAPEEGMPVLLRMKQDAHPISREKGTGDLYSTKPVPSKNMEYFGEDGGWYPVAGLKAGQ